MPLIPKVSVIIVNWNCKEDLPVCLRALEKQTARDFEVIIVDNGSTDDSVEMIRRDFPSVKVIEAGANLGFAEGCNVGIAAAAGEWIATLNPDTEPDPHWMEELLEVARTGSPRLGMIQSRIVFKHDSERTNSTGVLVFRNATFVDRSFDMVARDDEPSDEIFCVSAGAALYRRSMLDEVRLPTGYFDKTFFMYFEDVDLGWRCRLAGWSARYAPRAVVRHKLHASSKRKGNTFVARQCNYNRVRTLMKNGSPELLARAVPRLIADMKWSVKQEGIEAIGEYLRAARDGFMGRPRVEGLSQVSRRDVEARWVERRAPGSSSPRISVIVIASEGAGPIGDIVESIRSQTLSPIEIIIVSHGPAEASELDDPRLVRFVTEATRSQGMMRNRGAEEAKGDYFVFLDADHILEPEFLSRCWDALRTAPSHAAYAYSKARQAFPSKGPMRLPEREGSGPVCALWRRKAFDEVGGFDALSKIGFEEAGLRKRLAASGYSGVYVAEPLLRARLPGLATAIGSPR